MQFEINELVREAPMLALTRCIFVLLLITGFSANADSLEYQVYSDISGNIYLEAPKQFVLIHSDVAVPIWVSPKNGLIKLTKTTGGWQVSILSLSQWQQLQLTPGSSIVRSISYGDFDTDGITDIRLSFNNGQPAITIAGLTTVVKVIAPLRVVTFLHTDVLGSVVAESDSNGTIIKKTDYKPFGESKDN